MLKYFSLLLSLTIYSFFPLNSSEISPIDKQIEALKADIDLHRRKVMGAEIESQGMMLDDWSKYAEEIEIAEKNEQEIQKLEKQLDTLQHRKSEEQ